MHQQIFLNGNDWFFKDFHGEDWRWRKSYLPDTNDIRWWRIGSVPGSVQNDLWKLGEVEDPYYEQNSLKCEWVSQRSWLYKKKFNLKPDYEGKRIQLVFKGIDYSGHFYFNGVYLGSQQGMFHRVIFDISDLAFFDQENVLVVALEPSPSEQPQVGFTSKVSTHKSRMGYWWDFCPRLVHIGIWDDVYIEVTDAIRIEDIFIRPSYQPGATSAEVEITAAFHSNVDCEAVFDTSIDLDNRSVYHLQKEMFLTAGVSRVQISVPIENAQLWYPNGHGNQPLYHGTFSVLLNEKVSDKKEISFGIRSVSMVPNEEAERNALPYTLLVNGQKMYIKGWNWVPVDVLYGVPRPEKIKRLLQLAKNANVNMLRVWGGGLIEKDLFYDLCDQYGIMVWQEFIQSSSGIDNLPSTDEKFISFLVKEANDFIPQKRNHPSLVLWCGGNELQKGNEQPLDDHFPNLKALKNVVNELDPDRLWLPTSPTGRVFSNSISNIQKDRHALHDVHGPWEYQGTREQYDLYNQGSCLLHSEFGVEGITNRRALDASISKNNQEPVSLDTNRFWWHSGAWWVRRVVWDRVFGQLPDVKTYIRATQFIQFDGLRYALEADRRRKYHNSGTLPWQFNEPFPMAACTSAVDYFAEPKPAYYAVAQSYSALSVSARFDQITWRGEQNFSCQIWAANSTLCDYANLCLIARLIGVGGEEIKKTKSNVFLNQNRSNFLGNLFAKLDGVELVFFLDLRIQDEVGRPVADNRYCFTRDERLTPILSVPETDLAIKANFKENVWDIQITNIGDHSAMYVWLEDTRSLEQDGYVYFDRNYQIIFPGEKINIQANWDGVASEEREIFLQAWNTTGYRLNQKGLTHAND